MADDVIFGIGADNTDLKQGMTAAEAIIDSWAQSIEDRLSTVSGPDVDISDTVAQLSVLGEKAKSLGESFDRGEIGADGLRSALSQASDKADAIVKRLVDVKKEAGEAALAAGRMNKELRDAAKESARDDFLAKAFEKADAKANEVKKTITEVAEKAKDVELKLDTSGFERQFDRFDFSKPVDIPLRVDDGPIKDLFDNMGKVDSKATKIAASIGKWGRLVARVAGPIGIVVTAATKIASATEKWTRELSGYNDHLKRSVELQKELADQAARARRKEISAIQRNAGDDVDKEISALQKLEEQQRTAKDAAKQRLKDAEEAQKGLIFKREDPDSDTVGAFFNNRSGAIGQFLDGKFNSQLQDEVDKAQREFDEAEKAWKEFQGALDQASEKKLDLEHQGVIDAAKAQKELNRELKDTLSIEKEKQLRASGSDKDIAAADKIRDERSRRENRDKFAKLGAAEANVKADQVVAAEKETREAERRAEKEKETLDAKNKFLKDQERHEEQIAREREKAEKSDERFATKRRRLESRHDKERANENRAIGGVDASLSAAFSRISQSVNSPREDTEAQRLQELVKLENDAKEARKEQLAALKKIAGKAPEKPQGLL